METPTKITLAQQEALKRKASYSLQGTRKSRRHEAAQRVKTSSLRRIRDLFWDDDDYNVVEEEHEDRHETKEEKKEEDSIQSPCSHDFSTKEGDSSGDAHADGNEALCTNRKTPCLDDVDDCSTFTSSSAVEFNFGGRLRLKRIHTSPHIYTIDDFLSEIELNKIQEKIDLANKEKLFSKSFVDSDRGRIGKKRRLDGGNVENKSDTDGNIQNIETDRKAEKEFVVSADPKKQRTSTFIHFSKLSDSRIATIENRAAELLSLPNHSIEPLQLVRYEKGQYFNDHHDIGVLFEDGSVELPMKSSMTPPRRIVTILVYLNDLPHECGGATRFPLLQNGDGLYVRPKKGMAVLWCNVKKDGNPDQRLVHSGEPIKTDAIKYAMNIWACEA